MKAFGSTKRNGRVTVKAAGRRVNIAAILEAEAPITEAYKLREGEYFAKFTQNRNLWVSNRNQRPYFEGYITPEGRILRETQNEWDFIECFETEWFVYNGAVPHYPDLTFRIGDFGGCISGTIHHIKTFGLALPRFAAWALKKGKVSEYSRWTSDLPKFIQDKKVSVPYSPCVAGYINKDATVKIDGVECLVSEIEHYL